MRGSRPRFKEQNGLRLAAIHPTGALADWNKAHPEKEVKAGDLLLEATYHHRCIIYIYNKELVLYSISISIELLYKNIYIICLHYKFILWFEP